MFAKTITNELESLWNVIYCKLIDPCRLPVPDIVESEQLKINVLRVVLAAFAVWRTALIAYSSYYYYAGHGFLSCPSEFWLSLTCLVLTIFLMVGFMTPLAVLILIVMYNQMDFYLSTMTLGTNLFTLCLFFLLFTNCGSRLSVDALNLGNPQSLLHPVTRSLYNVIGFPSREQVRAYCWLLFMAYGVTSLSAVSLHIFDEFWRRGETVALMLQNSFLCFFWQTARDVARQCPALIAGFSIFACIGQVIFQLFMIPMVYTRWGVWFVGLWGAAFALVSVALLQISYIPTTEAVLWALIFSPAKWFAGVSRMHAVLRLNASGSPRAQLASISGAVTAAGLVAFALAVVVALGHHDGSPKLFKKAARHIGPVLYSLGLDVPDVFNRLDLSAGRCWYVMTRRHADGSLTRVPVSREDGGRLNYYWFDSLYFSNFVPWSRMMGMYSGDRRELLEPGKPGHAMIARIVDFDRRFSGTSRTCEYLVTVYAGHPIGLSDARVIATLSFPATRRLAKSSAIVR